MNLQSGRKSHQDLLTDAQQELKTAETYVKCVAVTEQNWKALIADLNAQLKVLQDIEERLQNLATRQYLTDSMKSHLETLITHTQNMKTEISQFNSNLQEPMKDLKKSLENFLTDTEKQVGKMSEQFSQSLSDEKQRLRKHTVKTYAHCSDTHGASHSLGADTAFLIGALSEIIDEDDETEDCTTQPVIIERKDKDKHHGPVMGGM